MKIVNLTPHDVRIRVGSSTAPTPDPSDVVYPSEGQARVTGRSEYLCDPEGNPRYVAGVRVVRQRYGDVTGLPEPAPGVLYVVSLLVMQALPERCDLVGPATGPQDGVVRDERGQIYAVRMWQSVAGSLPQRSSLVD